MEFMQLTYQLNTIDTEDGEQSLAEEATADRPMTFVSGLGAMIAAFERTLDGVGEGEAFDFTIPCAEAFGPFQEDRVVALPKGDFEVDGHFNERAICAGRVVPMQDEEGREYQAVVIDVDDDEVTLDFNHPYAGMDLHYVGRMVTRREATGEEIAQMLRILAGESPCGGNCGGCHSCG